MTGIKERLRIIFDVLRMLPAIAVKPPKLEAAVSIGGIFEATAARYQNRTMLFFEDREITWGELNSLANRMARALQDCGVQRGDCVALIMENRVEMVAYIIAMQKLGVVAALLNPALGGKQLIHCLKTATASKCIVGEEVFENLDAIRGEIMLRDEDILWVADIGLESPPAGTRDAMGALKNYASHNLQDTRSILAGATAFYIFTSGTTGLPKAAKVTHRRWVSGAYPYSKVGCRAKASDRFYICLPLYHGTGLICGLGSCLYSGSAIVLRRRFSVSQFWPDVQRYKVTNFIYVGELCRYLLAQPRCSEEVNNTLERVFGNGLRPDIWHEFKRRFGISRVCEFYGASEGNIGFLNALNKDCTIGLCSGNIVLVEYDVDADEIVRNADGKMVEVPVGQPGLLLGEVDDRYRFDGYTDTQASEQKMLRDVIKPGDVWFNTGDLIRQIDVGFALGIPHYQFVDRVGDTFRWRSENVSTNEVGEILNAHPAIESANVYGVDVYGADGKAGMVALVLREGELFDSASFSIYVNDTLPAFARPVFVRVQKEAVTTGTFKLVKGDLRREAYHIDQFNDQVYFMPPRGDHYRRLSRESYDEVVSGVAGY